MRIPLLALALAAPGLADDITNEVYKVVASDGALRDRLGSEVAIGAGFIAAGAPTRDSGGLFNSGAVYAFDSATGVSIATWTPNDLGTGQRFGSDIDVDGSLVVVASSSDDDDGINSGSAYLIDGSTGQFQAKLLPLDGAPSTLFGSAVAISGTSVVVGRRLDNDAGSDAGAAYVFDAGTGAQRVKFLGLDTVAGDQLGVDVDICGTVAIVGAPFSYNLGPSSGSAYLFDAFSGQQVQKLLPLDGAAVDLFGISVAVSDSVAIVGAPRHSAAGVDAGAAYLFDIQTGAQIAKLQPPGLSQGEELGWHVAISGDLAAVSAVGNGINGGGAGCVYLFHVPTGVLISRLLPSDGSPGELFGVPSFGPTCNGAGQAICVGNFGDDLTATDQGSAYLFMRPPSPGAQYCSPASTNSTGGWATLATIGSNAASGGELLLVAEQLPPFQFGYFLNSRTQGSAFPPGSQGRLCLSGFIGRYANQLLDAGPSGRVELLLDLAATPTPNASYAIQPGETWNFQLWYRDANPGPTSNFSEAVSITFD